MKKMQASTEQATARGSKRGPGRPEGISVVRDEIMDAAEIAFSSSGFAGTGLREVAEKAKVTQALINYYFGSKLGLFEEVFLRRSHSIAKRREELLDELEERGNTTVKDIVRAFLLPTLAMRETPQGRAFLRLQARLHTEPPEISYKIRGSAYGHSAQRYVEAFRRVLPHLKELDLYWRMTLMIGSYLYAFSDTHRMEALAPEGLYDAEDTEELIDQVTRFVVGGFGAP